MLVIKIPDMLFGLVEWRRTYGCQFSTNSRMCIWQSGLNTILEKKVWSGWYHHKDKDKEFKCR